ncbi:uncharacterized protein LOC143923722 [Lithobates pipiens]
MKISTLLGKEMSPLGLLLLLFLQHTGFAGAALGYVLFTHSARMGSNTTIPCKFDVNAVPPAQRTFSVIWHFQGKEIFKYPNNPGVLNSRLSIDQDRIKDGTADLYMSGVSISDGGLYKCSMTEIPGEKEKEIRLDVYAPPRITITGKNINISKENVLTCAISGFYPVDIDIKWLRDGIILNNVTLEKPQRDPDGMYSMRSSVTIIPTEKDRKRTFSCRIQHESLPTPLQEDFKLLYGDTTSSTLIIIIPVVAGVVILIIITVVAILCVKRKGKNNQNKVKNQDPQEEKLMSSNQQAHRLAVIGNRVPERQQSCSEQSGNWQAPVYSAVIPASVHPTSATGLKPVTAAPHSSSNIPSPQGTKDIRLSLDMQTKDSDRGQAAQQHKIAHRPTEINNRVPERQQSCSKQSGNWQAPVYSSVLPSSVQPTSDTGLKPVTAATHSNSNTPSPQGTKDLRLSLDMQTKDSDRGQAEQQHKIGNRGGVNSAKSAAEDRTREIRSPGYKKTTSEAVSPGPRDTRLFINKETEPSNQENNDDKRVRVAELVKQIEAKEKKMKP